MFTVSPQRIRVYTAPDSVTVGLVPRGKLQNCCEIGKDFVLNRVFLLLYAKLESAAEIGSVRYFFGCHILGRKTVRSHSHFTNPPPPSFSAIRLFQSLCVSLLSKRVFKT